METSARRRTGIATEGRGAAIIHDYARFQIAHCDPERRYLFVNRSYAERLGLTHEHVSASTFGMWRASALTRLFVDATVEAAHPLIHGKSHHLTVTLPPEPITIDADPLRLSQVLSNLLTNAAKYTDPGGHIELRVVRQNGILAFALVKGITELHGGTVDVKSDGLGRGSEFILHLSTAAVDESAALPWRRCRPAFRSEYISFVA